MEEKIPIWQKILIILLFSPLLLFIFLCVAIYTPFNYIQFKTSRYHKDFGGKFSFTRFGVHWDNKYYTIIKKNNLPIEYLKFDESYESLGRFVYRNSLLIFDSPLWYNEERSEWVSEDYDNEDNEAIFTLEETKQEYLKFFHEKFPERKCNDVVFFMEKKSFKKHSSKATLRSAKEIDCFVVYEGKLVDTLKKFVNEI